MSLKLVEIEIEGFKSFGKYTRIKLSDGITAIVGPNGSGKSNIVDAIRWAFGSHSHKDLRTPKKEDVFFSGSPNLSPANKVMVSLKFGLSDGDTMTISREMTRDGRNTYRINGENVRLKDLLNKFYGTGVGKELYSIIAQGQIEKIVNSSPEDLRILIEEAANISKFRIKKKETLKKIEETKHNLNRVEDIMNELEREMRSLYLKAKRAEKYKEYSENLKDMKRKYFSDRINHLRRKLLDYNNSIELHRERLKEVFKNMAEVENKLTNLRTEFGMVDKEIEKMTRMIEDYRNRETSLRELKSRYLNELKDLENSYLNKTMELNSIEKSIENGEKRVSELEMIISTMVKRTNEMREKLENLRSKRDEIYSVYSEKEKEFMKTKERIEFLKSKKMKLENEKFKLNETIKDLKNRLNMMEEQLKIKSKRYEESSKELEELMILSERKGKEEENLRKKSEELKDSILNMNNALNILDTKYHDLMNRKNAKLSKLDTLKKEFEEYTGFSESVKNIFKWKEEGKIEGVIDVVVNLMEVEKEYSKSLDALLGARSNYIVVEKGENAVKILEMLKTRKIGRATFLPLDLINNHNSSRRSDRKCRLDELDGFIGYAKDLVKVSDRFRKVTDYLFGDSVVVEKIEDAIRFRKMGYKMRMVSLDGDLLERGGAISGGFSKNTGSILMKKAEMKKLEDELKNVENEIERLLDERTGIEKKMKGLKEEKMKIDQQLADSLLKNESMRRTIEDLKRGIEELKKEITSLVSLKQDYMGRMNGYHSRIERIDEEEKCIDVEITKLNDKLKEFDDSLREKKKELQELENTILELNITIENEDEKRMSYNEELDRLRKDMENWEIRKYTLSREISKITSEIDEKKKSIEELDTEMKMLKKEIDELFEGMKLHREGKEKKIKDIEELEKYLDDLKNEADNLKNTIHDMELEIREIQTRYQNTYDEVTNSDITLDELDDTLILDDVERNEMKRRIDELEKKLRFIGNVDLSSIDEYKDVESRYMDLKEQRNDLLKAMKSLNEIIEKTEEEARRIFLNTFDLVSKNFSKMISDLFDGATGEMKLIYSDDPLNGGIEISIRKLGRKEEKLNLLSGGEKSLVGLAILFSLLNINPSPFYILDEVDAALDDYNSERLKRTLLRYSGKTQFIVITHNKLVMEGAKKLYGITMNNGVSTVVSVEYEKIKEKVDAMT